MDEKHTYSQKSFGSYPFHVVHTDGKVGSAVAGSTREDDANSDAQARNQRARQYGLTCKYVVRKREEGQAVEAVEQA